MTTTRALLLLLPALWSCAPATPALGPDRLPPAKYGPMEIALRASCGDPACTSIIVLADALHEGPIRWAFQGEHRIRGGKLQSFDLPPESSSWTLFVWNQATGGGVKMVGQVVSSSAEVPDDQETEGPGSDPGPTGGFDTGMAEEDSATPSASFQSAPNYLQTTGNKIIVSINSDGTISATTPGSCKYIVTLGGTYPGIGGCVTGNSAVRLSILRRKSGITVDNTTFQLDLPSQSQTGPQPTVQSMGIVSAARWNVLGSTGQHGNWTPSWLAAEVQTPLLPDSISLAFDASTNISPFYGKINGTITVSHPTKPGEDTWIVPTNGVATYQCNQRTTEIIYPGKI